MNSSLFQLAVDMLIRLGRSEEVFQLFINNKMIFEALNFVYRYKVKIEFINSETLDKLKLLVIDNPELIRDFLLV